MALELAPYNICVNAIAPGMTDTAQPRYGNTDAELIEMAKATIPLGGKLLTPDQIAAIQWLAAQPGGPAKVAVISEDWSSDCRRDVPYLARLAKAGGLELRIFTRDGDAMRLKGVPDPAEGGNADLVAAYANGKNGQRWASVPVAVFFTEDFVELYRYIEYPAIYRKERVLGHLRAARGGESPEAAKARGGAEIGALLESPFYDVWAQGAIAEILAALHERLLIGPTG
jgi:hypothetical protein